MPDEQTSQPQVTEQAPSLTTKEVIQTLRGLGGSNLTKLYKQESYEAIKETLQMSKKSFKKAIGSLYKQKLITIKEDGIHLN